VETTKLQTRTTYGCMTIFIATRLSSRLQAWAAAQAVRQLYL